MNDVTFSSLLNNKKLKHKNVVFPFACWKNINASFSRYVDSLRYGYRFRYSQHVSRLDLYESLCFENADAAMLRLFEAFMEAAPQLVLQIYILVRKQTKESTDYEKFDFLQILQIISIFSSWFSLATAMATFHRAQRFSQHAKGKYGRDFSAEKIVSLESFLISI
jgi:XK-related protein